MVNRKMKNNLKEILESNKEARELYKEMMEIINQLYGINKCLTNEESIIKYRRLREIVGMDEEELNKENKKGVYIERAAKLDSKGIKAVCGTEEEYGDYTKELNEVTGE